MLLVRYNESGCRCIVLRMAHVMHKQKDLPLYQVQSELGHIDNKTVLDIYQMQQH